jgi:hypothetical protein
VFESLDEPQPKPQGPANYAGIVIFITTIPFFLFFRHIGQPYMAITVPVCLAANGFVVGICWKLRARPWFWCVVVLILLLHVPLILRIHWPPEWDFGRAVGLVLLPFAVADGLITLGAVRFVQKFMKEPPSDDDE